jgi:ribosomal protein S4|tara:strand:+ start:72 stop:722 length:651 start_codon:yes stop_codon:yes gene_type:complete
MSTHKTKPKLKKYKTAGLTKKRNTSRVSFFLPEYTYLTHHLKKLEHTFSNSLNNRRRIKLLFGFNQSYKLLNFIKEIEKKNTHKKRFSKANGLINLIEHRLDVVLLRANFASTLSQARQLISHRQVYVNGIVVTSSFFVLKKRDIISVSPSIRKIVKQNIKQSIQNQDSMVSQYNSFEVNYTIQKIIIISDSLKTNEFINLNKQELNLLFTKCLKG